jgi:hypothetical protein
MAMLLIINTLSIVLLLIYDLLKVSLFSPLSKINIIQKNLEIVQSLFFRCTILFVLFLFFSCSNYDFLDAFLGKN